MTIVALMCAVAFQVNAQTEELETKGQKFFRLTKAADDNPTDWNAQLEAGHFLLDKDNGVYNQSQAVKYYERLYHLATDYNKEIPDSVIREAAMMLMSVASDKKDLDKALFYIDAMIHADKVGVNLGEGCFISFASMGMLYSMIKDNMPQALLYMMELRERLTRDKLPGIEHTDITTAVVFEELMRKYKEMFGDKLLELTMEGKRYIVISMNDWNIEKPFLGWTMGEKKSSLLYGEDGKVYDDLHGEMEYSFFYNKEGIKPQEGTNSQLITVTPERRQQLVEAYRKYIEKAKKNKKK